MKSKAFFKSALNHGIILGVIMILTQVLMWMVNFVPVGISKGLLSLLLFFIIYLILLFLFMKAYRNSVLGGYIPYGNAFLYGLLVFLIASILGAIYNLIFLTFIDPQYTARVVQETINWTENFMKSKGVPDLDIDKATDKIRSKPIPGPLSASLRSILFGLIFGAIVSLISAAFAKKEENPLHQE